MFQLMALWVDVLVWSDESRVVYYGQNLSNFLYNDLFQFWTFFQFLIWNKTGTGTFFGVFSWLCSQLLLNEVWVVWKGSKAIVCTEGYLFSGIRCNDRPLMKSKCVKIGRSKFVPVLKLERSSLKLEQNWNR